MDLRQLTTFRAVAQTLSFHRAAAQLHYVQSSVSTQIQLLEEELGVKLFDRLGKRVVLTEAGQQLLLYAEKILCLADEARTAIMEGDGPHGILTISAPETLWTYRLPALLKCFRERFPRVQLQFRHFPSKELLQRVLEGVIDVAFVLDEPLQATTVCVEQLIPEPLVIIAAPDSPLACLTEVGPLDLDGQQLLLTEAGCSYRNLFYRALASKGVHANNVLEFASVEAIKQCVMVGLGVAALPEVVVEKEIAQGQLAALPWKPPDENLAAAKLSKGIVTQMLWHKDKWLSPSLQAFLNLTREMLKVAEASAFGA
jgi:DNA-binding transcriptional LysR family regulator